MLRSLAWSLLITATALGQRSAEAQRPASPETPEGFRTIAIETVEPGFHGVPGGRLLIGGSGFDEAGEVYLLSVETDKLPVSYTVVSDTEIHVTLPTDLPEVRYLLFITHVQRPARFYASTVFIVDPPLPVVTSVVPNTAPADQPPSIVMRGTDFDGAYGVWIEGPGDTQLPLERVEVVSDTRIDATLPAELDPGTYLVRVVTEGGISIDGSTFEVTAPLTSAPRVELASQWEAATTSLPTVVTLTGSRFTGTTSVIARGDADVGLAFRVVSDSALEVTLPARMAPDLYDYVVTTPQGACLSSEAKLVVVDPSTSVDYLGDGRVLGIGGTTVRYQTTGYYAVIDGARLAFFVNLLTGRPIVSQSEAGAVALGVLWETISPGTTLLGEPNTAMTLAGNVGARGVDFRVSYQGTVFLTYTWSIGDAFGSLRLNARYNTMPAIFPGNVNEILFSSIDLVSGVEQITAALGGKKLGWSELFTARLFGPTVHDYWLAFLEDPDGGGVLVDLVALGSQSGYFVRHERAGALEARRTRLDLPHVTPQKTALQAGQLGPVHFIPKDDNWAAAIDPYQETVTNPLRPSFLDQITSVCRSYRLSPQVTPALIRDLWESIEPDVPDPGDYRLFEFLQNEDEVDSLPDWALSANFERIAKPLHEGFGRVIPAMSTPGIDPNHPSYPAWADRRLAAWSRTSQAIAWRFWDDNRDGRCCAAGDFWLMNPEFAPYRAALLQQAQTSFERRFAPDGIYFDFIKGNSSLADRNMATGSPLDGWAALASEFHAAFADPEFLIAGEGCFVAAARFGVSLMHNNTINPGTLEEDPTGGLRPMAFSHPFGTYLVLDDAILAPDGGGQFAGTDNAHHRMVDLTRTIQGGTPIVVLLAYNRAWTTFALKGATRRAAIQYAEEGLHRRVHGVRPYNQPHALWDDPETLRLFEVDGVVEALTKDWYARKLVCDLFWQFGGRAPSQAELDDLMLRTRANNMSIFAAVCEVRKHFQDNPTPLDELQTRKQARDEIVLVFPDYPVP